MYSTIACTSSSETHAPCTRMLFMPLGTNSMSPLPSSFSAPPWSIIVRLSTWLATEKAMRVGMLALMMPVMTFTDGRCVAMTRCMPQARASWARRQMESSTSPGETIIKSASSSMMMTICGISRSPFFSALL